MKKLIYLLISVTILLNSCAKETVYLEAGEEDGTVSSGTLGGTKWRMTSLILGQEISGQKTEQDLFPLAENCAKDDVMMFNAGNNFVYDEGASKCDSGDPQQEAGTWTLSDDKKKLTLTSESINNTPEPIIYDVVFTSTKLTLSYKESSTINVGGQDVKTTIYTIFSFAPHK